VKRIAIVGSSCAGKSTLARELAARLEAPHVELDALHWLPNWTPRKTEDFRELVDQATACERWIADGNYHQVRDLVWKRATHLVWLNYSLPVVFSRALRRTTGRILSRERFLNGNRETFRGAFLSWDGIPLWVLRTYARRRREYPRLLASPDFAHLAVMILASPRETESFLSRVRAAAASPSAGQKYA
jgi:hypothetical protein